MNRRDFAKAVGIGLAGIAAQGTINFLSGLGYESDLSVKKISLERQRYLMGLQELPIITESNFDGLVYNGMLVSVPEETETYFLDRRIRERCPFVTPCNKILLDVFALEHHNKFEKRLKINSLSRTWEYQIWLRKFNSNAIAPSLSGHVRGVSLDLSYTNMSRTERLWMRNKLSSLQDRVVLAAVEEKEQPVFHTDIFKDNFYRYMKRITKSVDYSLVD